MYFIIILCLFAITAIVFFLGYTYGLRDEQQWQKHIKDMHEFNNDDLASGVPVWNKLAREYGWDTK